LFCKPGEKPELKAVGLPWSTALVAGEPIKLEVTDMQIAIRCNGAALRTYAGTLSPQMLNGGGVGEAACTKSTHTTFAEFREALETLKIGGESAGVGGRDCMWGAAGNEKITVESP
jgi:hypothetical protein